MERIPVFDAQHLEAACKVLADAEKGMTGPQIAEILEDIRVLDVTPDMSNWKRLFNALSKKQSDVKVGNHLIMFITRAMSSVNYALDRTSFEWRRDELNEVLSFSGLMVRENGKVARTEIGSDLESASARAERMRLALEGRHVRQEVLNCCEAEFVEENYFHAVLAASNVLAQRIRELSGLTTNDGVELANAAFDVRVPVLALNALITETEKAEQKAFGNALIGVFGALGAPLLSADKTAWAMSEQDALDLMTAISMMHRKLDRVVRV